MQTAFAAAPPSPHYLSSAGQRSSWSGPLPQSRNLGASYDSVTAYGPRQQQQQQQQHRGIMSSQPRRAAMPVVPSHLPSAASPALMQRLGSSFDEPQPQYQCPPVGPPLPSRRMLSQSVSSPHEHDRAQGWSLGASVYCRFAILRFCYCVTVLDRFTACALLVIRLV